MNKIFISLLIFQALLMLVDEFYFHHKRGLGRWESLGHPMDTLSVILVFTIPLLFAPIPFSKSLYFGGAVFSCFLVTKDEFVHQRECSAGEHWVHSILFLLHPVLFISLFLLWNQYPKTDIFLDLSLRSFLFIHLALLTSFMLYQLLYWRGGKLYANKN